MRKLSLLLLLLLPISTFAQDKVEATLFYSPGCKACLKIKEDFLPDLKQKYADKLAWRELNTKEEENLSQLLALVKQFKREKALVPAILVGNNLLIGKEAIIRSLDPAIQRTMATKYTSILPPQVDLVEVFKGFSILAIVVAGLIDGINPCAFAVIIFFISFLAVYGYKKKEILHVGTAYCLAVFSTYFLVGLGLFQFLYSISQIYLLIKTFYYLVAFFCFFLAALAFIDYFKFKRGAGSQELILRLPNFLKKRINVAIGSRLREKGARGSFDLLITSFVIGFLVSLLEAVCTGQIYVPVIVSILKYPQLRVRALTYMVLYNLMFITPLIIVFILAFFGVNSQKLDIFLKKNLGAIKILMGLVFITLGVFILGYDHIYAYIFPFFEKILTRCLN